MFAGQDFNDLNRSPYALPRAALNLAKALAYPGLDVSLYLNLLDGLAGWAKDQMTPDDPAHTQAKALAVFLFRQLGFRGNRSDYYDPRNSFLNDVLNRRMGIPISLSVVYLTIAQQLGLDAQGVGMPGHFIVRIETREGELYLDPYHQGKLLSLEDCARLVRSTTGYDGPFRREWLNPLPPGGIFIRMLNNIKEAYKARQDWASALKIAETLRLIQPDEPGHLRELGWLYSQSGSLRRAIDCYEQYLAAAPEAEDIEQVKQLYAQATQDLARLN